MLKFFNANQKNALSKLGVVLNERKLKQKTNTSNVKKILSQVKKW